MDDDLAERAARAIFRAVERRGWNPGDRVRVMFDPGYPSRLRGAVGVVEDVRDDDMNGSYPPVTVRLDKKWNGFHLIGCWAGQLWPESPADWNVLLEEEAAIRSRKCDDLKRELELRRLAAP